MAMEADQWHESHQGIAFNESGQLVDGQHRLMAITLSKKTIQMLVTRGVPHDAMATMDSGARRTIADSLTILRRSRVDARLVAAVVKLMHFSSAYQPKDEQGRQSIGKHFRANADVVNDVLRRHQVALEWAVGCLATIRTGGKRIGTAKVAAVLARAFYHVKTSRLNELVAVLRTGIMEGEKDSMGLALRDWLMDKGDSHPTPMIGYFRIERCIQAFAAEEPVRRIFPVTEELYPLPEEKAGYKAPSATTALGRLRLSRAEKSKKAAVSRKFSKDSL